MKILNKQILGCVALGILATACVDKTNLTDNAIPTSPATTEKSCEMDIKTGSDLGVKPIPTGVGSEYKNSYCKYTEIIADNGKAIRIFAQDQISNEQMIRARRILEFFLSPVAGSEQGVDKVAIANQMADGGATLVLMNGSDDGSNPVTVNAQPLYDAELVTEGSVAYINNDYENHRDAAFEEILHMMHDYGIGTKSQPGANMTYSQQIDAATSNGMVKSLWPTAGVDTDTTAWIEELRKEGSLSQEYLASVIDSYYGYWGAWKEDVGGMWGIYTAKTRAEVKAKDPQGYSVVEGYFSPTITYMARIDSGFDGTFSLVFDSNNPYTHKSQYLVNAELTGKKNSSLRGNAHDNRLIGNAGVNTLDGQEGTDTVIFKGTYSEYTVDVSETQVIVNDSVSSRDGVTTLKNLEIIVFKNENYRFLEGKLISDNG